MLGKFIIAYNDNILIYSSNLESHVNHVKKVLAQLLENHLFVKAENCISQIAFLGYVISAEGGTTDENKIISNHLAHS